MDRKEFIKKSFQACVVCCGAAAGLESIVSSNSGTQNLFAQEKQKTEDSPDAKKANKAISWIKDMLDSMDEQLDEETKNKLIYSCGRACYVSRKGPAPKEKPSKEKSEEFINALEKEGMKVERNSETTTIYVGWPGKPNPKGEPLCYCLIAEADTPVLSRSFCNCSVGSINEMIERNTGRKVSKTKVLKAIKWGDKECLLKVELNNI